MAATVQIRELNGVGPTATDKTSATIRFKDADNAAVDLNAVLRVPSSGRQYSFRKVLRTYVSGGAFTQIANLRAYLDGSNGLGTGVKLWYATTGTYTQPAVPDEANDPPQFPGVTPMADAFGLTVGSPGDLDGVNTGPFDSTGVPKEIGDYLNLVLEVETTAGQGVTPGETLTVAWDEI